MLNITKERLNQLRKMSVAEFAAGLDSGKISKEERRIFMGLEDFRIAGEKKVKTVLDLRKEAPAKKPRLKKSDGRLTPKFIAHLRRLARNRHMEAIKKNRKKSSSKPSKLVRSASANTSKRVHSSTKKAS